GVELILSGVLGSDAREIVGRAAARRIRVALQQLRGDRIERVCRNQIARVGAMIRRTKDLAHACLDDVAIRVGDVEWIGCDCCRYRTVWLQKEKRAEAGREVPLT